MLKCCDDCFRKLASINTRSAILWADLLRDWEGEPTFFSHDCDNLEHFKMLEYLHFIVTTECDYNWLAARINGINLFENFVCIHPGSHCERECI